jgi:hypothetical protein
MTVENNPVPGAAYMLADHLDAALAAGEDILAAGKSCEGIDIEAGAGQSARLRSSIELIRALELALITRVLKAREWSQTLLRTDPRFKMVASLFMGGSVPLVDALAEFADATEADFETGDGITAYFRARGVIDAEAPSLDAHTGPLVTETFRLAGRIELGALLDLIAAYLDALEVHFTLFAAERTQVSSASAKDGGTEARA